VETTGRSVPMTLRCHDWLAAYTISRSSNAELADRYFERLQAELGLSELPARAASHEEKAVAVGNTTKRDGKSSFLGKVLCELWSSLSAIREMWRPIAPRAKALFIISDPSRIGPWSSREDILESVTARKQDFDSDIVADMILVADQIYVISPNLLARENSAILSDLEGLTPLTLIISALMRPIDLIGTLLRIMWELKSVSSKILFLAAVDAGFSNFLRRFDKSSVLMLTSNSHMVEQLRWSALCSDRVDLVAEILHGIPTEELREYQRFLSGSLGKKRMARMLFIGLAPRTALGKEFESSPLYHGDYIVNLKFNAINADQVKDGVNRYLDDAPIEKETYKISINGGAYHLPQYYSSPAHSVELHIVGMIRDIASEIGKRVFVSYSVHPAHIKSGQAAQVCGDHSVDMIEPDSLNSWLTSDLCISLYSSSYWDAKFLGCAGFLAVAANDGFFAHELLDEGCHIAEGQTAPDALRQALIRAFALPPIAQVEIAQRLARLQRAAQRQ
jgi:hypothetical protein